MRYFIQYAAGTGDLILDALASYIARIDVRYRDDSSMIFDSDADIEVVAAAPFVKNAFAVIAATPRGSVDRGVEQLSRVLPSKLFPRVPLSTRNFRLMIHIDGELSPVDKRAKSSLEHAVAGKTGGRVEPRGMCQEYWVIGRIDLNDLLFCARLPKVKRSPKAKGAISYELSSMLISASRPHPRDVFLDPFAGSGSFILARRELPARKIWYSDLDQSLRNAMPREVHSDKRIRFLTDDALVLPSFSDGGVDVIVTDPPWGEYEDVGMSYQDFSYAVAKSMDRVLDRTRGRFVVLSARRTAEIMENALRQVGFVIVTTHEILINGHPASVVVGGRSAAVAE